MPKIDENEEVIYIIDGSGQDGKAQVGDDLKEEIIETLATYLRCLSVDGQDGNKFKVSKGIQKSHARDENGDPAPLDDHVRGSENPYAATVDNPSLSTYSDSKDIFLPSIGSFLKKGKADTFIKDIEGQTNKSGQSSTPQSNDPTIRAVMNALDNNRFSPGVNGPYVGNTNRGEDRISPDTIARVQREFGVYTAPNTSNPSISGKSDIKLSELQQIGHSLMLRAAREVRGVQEGNPSDPGFGALTLIPGGSQIGVVKVDTNNMRASTVMEENFDIEKIRTDTENAINPSNKSWGHLNTPFEPYDGFLPIGMTLLGTALAISIKLVTQAFVGFLSLMVKEKLAHIPNRGPFVTGEYGKEDLSGFRAFSLRAIGIRETERDFLTVVNSGLDVFFDFSDGKFKRLLKEPQTYIILVRSILRSGNTIVNSVSDVFTNSQNPIEGAQAFLGLIDILKSSKIIAFLNVLAQLGDKAEEIREQGFDPKDRKKSSLDNLPVNPATNVMRVRGSRSGLKSGMQTSATLSKFVFPSEILRAGSLLAHDNNTNNFDRALASMPQEHVALRKDIDGNGRIKKEIVEEVETQLDSEYVPFYFHDLRTNEIVSFHAFLDSLEDAYTPLYESTQTFGRIDNIRTYSSTERTLTLSFNIVSTNKEDFDFMWWKVNKLTSLVYPSWSEGRQVSGQDGTKFIQPFSQIPASTPVIRLRIGDLIRSNYSKFGLQRLFGVGSDKSDILKTRGDPDIVLEAKKKKILEIRARMLRNPALTDRQDGYQPGETAILLPKRNGYPTAEGPSPLKGAARAKALFGKGQNKKLVITSSAQVEIVGPKIPIGFAQGGAKIEPYGEHSIAYYKIKVKGTGADSDEMSGEFLVTHDDLVPDPESVIRSAGLLNDPIIPAGVIKSQGIDDDGQIFGSDIENPFSAQNNSIVKSFESIQGKGLGGVITGLTFTDLAAPTIPWETSEFGARAPKMLKCNITFAVIHDIAPGIDHTGFMRAIQYPVGQIAHRLNGDTYNGSNGTDNKSEGAFTSNHRKAGIALRNQNKKGQ